MNALYSEITTGMSAPPMGMVIITPYTSASPKNTASSSGVGTSRPAGWMTMTAPRASSTSSSVPLMTCRPGRRSVPLM